MTNTYEFEVRAMCPVHEHLIDCYQVTVRTAALIKVETILEVFKRYEGQRVWQETMTAEAAVALGAQVETVGMHGGVKVRSIAP